jgi:hypothetical protein
MSLIIYLLLSLDANIARPSNISGQVAALALRMIYTKWEN